METTWTEMLKALVLLGSCLIALRVLQAVKANAQAANHHDADKASAADEKVKHQRSGQRVQRSQSSTRRATPHGNRQRLGRASAAKKAGR